MAIEKLYLTDTFRVWAEKFNATIQASNTATATAEEAINKANEAIKKAEQAFNDSVKGDDITTIVNEERQVVAKDIAIDGDTSDLASGRGQIGDNFNLPEDIDLNTVLTPGFYGVRGVTAINCPTHEWGYLQVVDGFASSNNYHRAQIWLNVGDNSDFHIYIRDYYRNNDNVVQWSEWIKTIINTDLATNSTLGIVQPDNTTITIQNGIISAKTLGTLDGTTVVNNDFNNLTTAGRYFISTVQDTTTNAPINVTADWWVDVFTYGSDSTKKIIQEARMHSTTSSSATSGVANYLARCCTGTTWGPWEYAYTQFAG